MGTRRPERAEDSGCGARVRRRSGAERGTPGWGFPTLVPMDEDRIQIERAQNLWDRSVRKMPLA